MWYRIQSIGYNKMVIALFHLTRHSKRVVLQVTGPLITAGYNNPETVYSSDERTTASGLIAIYSLTVIYFRLVQPFD